MINNPVVSSAGGGKAVTVKVAGANPKDESHCVMYYIDPEGNLIKFPPPYPSVGAGAKRLQVMEGTIIAMIAQPGFQWEIQEGEELDRIGSYLGEGTCVLAEAKEGLYLFASIAS